MLCCARASAQARVAYEGFVADTRAAYAADKVQDGVFGAKMVVDISNDGARCRASRTLHCKRFPPKNVRVLPARQHGCEWCAFKIEENLKQKT